VIGSQTVNVRLICPTFIVNHLFHDFFWTAGMDFLKSLEAIATRMSSPSTTSGRRRKLQSATRQPDYSTVPANRVTDSSVHAHYARDARLSCQWTAKRLIDQLCKRGCSALVNTYPTNRANDRTARRGDFACEGRDFSNGQHRPDSADVQRSARLKRALKLSSTL
jgi:hypothetical protein